MWLKTALASVGVAAAVVVPAAPAHARGCDIPVVQVGSTSIYTGVSGGAAVCVSVTYAAGWSIGIDNVGAIPYMDSYTDACPTSDDIAAGALADPSNPLAYTPYRVAAGVYETQAQICVITRDVRVRLVFTAEAGTPRLTLQDDWTPSSDPYVAPGSASRTCQDLGAPPLTITAGPAGAFVSWALASDAAYFCVRAGGVGGRLRLDADGNAGPVTTVATRLDCPTSWWSTSAPVATSVRTGPLRSDGRLPVCVSAAGFEFNFFVHTTYRPGVPVADWVFDQ